MNKFELGYFGVVLLGVSLSCGASSTLPQKSPPSTPQPPASINQQERNPELINDLYVKAERLSYNGYEVMKQEKQVKIPHTRGLTDVSYAVVKKDNRVLARFDGIYSGWGNATDFGLFAFLSGKKEQLAVSQTIPRGGRHWVVNLSPAFRIIYDSGEWEVGREDLVVLDIDKDGMYEIIQEVTAFYSFDKFPSISETPLPRIVFKFDQQVRKYLPANHRFQNYMLSGIEEQVRGLDPKDERFYLSWRLNIALRYIYAGKEEEAWSFFDKEYRRPDKEEMKTKVRALLRKQPVYRFIYGSRAKLR